MIREAPRRRQRKYEFEGGPICSSLFRATRLIRLCADRASARFCVDVFLAAGHVVLVKISGCKSQCLRVGVLAAVAHYKREFACRARTSLTTKDAARCLGSRNMQSTSDKKARANSTA